MGGDKEGKEEGRRLTLRKMDQREGQRSQNRASEVWHQDWLKLCGFLLLCLGCADVIGLTICLQLVCTN